MQFLKYILASAIGFFVALTIVVIAFVGIIVGSLAALKGPEEAPASAKSVLQVSFNYIIEERTNENPLDGFDFKNFKANTDPGLESILALLDKAKTDSRIEGIFLDLSMVHAGMATLEEIRNALIDFRQSKKFVVAYSEEYTQAAYYLASVADKVYLNPQGILELKGLRAELLFFKGALEKLELQPEIIRHGKFKSAVEPFLLDKMSEESRLQTKTFMESIWNNVLDNIAASRNNQRDELTDIASQLRVQTPDDAVKYKLVDGLKYYDEVLAELGKRIGLPTAEKLKLLTLAKYDAEMPDYLMPSGKDQIAVIYASGTITDGKGTGEGIASIPMAAEIRKARQDASIKGIVFRINSPGGSAMASEVIWREISLARKVKPVVVSMGDYAASGGYYIACAADTIVAEPNTLTGSIGVFGVLFNSENFLKNKLGITVDRVKTGAYSDIGTFTRPMTAAEREIIQHHVERVYATFVKRVADGRKVPPGAVDSIGQGRVWSGTDAKRIGLVDVLGDLNKAVNIAAGMAKLKDYTIVSLPERKHNPLSKMIRAMSKDAETAILKQQLGESYRYWQKLNSLVNSKGIQARIPFEVEFY